MVFLIEGIDGCGKTTAIENLKKMFPDIVFIKESYPGDSVEERAVRLERLQVHVNMPAVFIYDRCTALDDFIYEPVIANKDSMLDWNRVAPLLAECKIIYLDCDLNVVKERLEQRGDQYVNTCMLDTVLTEYMKRLACIPKVRINVTNMNEEEECNAIADVIISSIDLYGKKRPKLAHIVPRDLLSITSLNQYHMSLAHLIKQDKDYLQFYRRMVAAGRYVLMDNGAAENAQLSNEDLLECYNQFHPTEIVLPDTLCNKNDTLRKVREAVPFFLSNGVTCKFMAVPQGQTLEEWEECAEELISMPYIHCLGVSKFLTIQTGDPDVRYKAVEYIDQLRAEKHRDDLEVHLLGCDVGPSEPGKIFKDFNFVRGCDTALAYIYAQAGVELTKDSKRPAGEMSFIQNTLRDPAQLRTAIKSFNNIACVNNIFGDYTWF